LYNVIKNLREQKGKMFHRLVYIAKLEDSLFRGDYEKEFSNWVDNVTRNPDEEEIPLEDGMKLEHDGLAYIIAPYIVHLFEAE
jgi:hypothetical protein